MIELIEGLPGEVVGVIAKGQVTATDYEDVLIPAIQAALKEHPRIRCYYELGHAFSGMDPDTLWRDFRIGMEHWTRWERIALVTDHAWITHAANALCFLMPAPVHVFSVDERREARAWITAK